MPSLRRGRQSEPEPEVEATEGAVVDQASVEPEAPAEAPAEELVRVIAERCPNCGSEDTTRHPVGSDHHAGFLHCNACGVCESTEAA